ncbi:MAG: hypothetical protein JXR96_15420 [Deltaproteobacteria bacterium]|nr:hypothetical protein [Deltaproteobacteria bacterium]
MRDFRALLADERFWDRCTQAIYERCGEPLDDCCLQNREEVIGLCEFIEAQGVRSYLEIGVWTGRLVSALQRVFGFEKVSACDHGWAERCGFAIHLPPGCRFCRADSTSRGYLEFRAALGQVDLVFIDAAHGQVRRDFEINRGFPHRFLAFHDIAGQGRHTAAVQRFWRELDSGIKVSEIVRPHRELGRECSDMGIGIWAAR